MTKFELIIELIDKLIWPLTTLIVFFLIRKQFRLLTPFIKKIKISEFELEIDRELAKVNAQAKSEFKPINGHWKTHVVAMAQNSPTAAVLYAWDEIEAKSEALILKKDPKTNLDSSTKFKLMQELLVKMELIEAKKAKIYGDLRQIRNKVAHAIDYEISREQALNYINISIQLVDYMEQKLTALEVNT